MLVDELLLQYVLALLVLLAALVCSDVLPAQAALTLRAAHIAHCVQASRQQTLLTHSAAHIDTAGERGREYGEEGGDTAWDVRAGRQTGRETVELALIKVFAGVDVA